MRIKHHGLHCAAAAALAAGLLASCSGGGSGSADPADRGPGDLIPVASSSPDAIAPTGPIPQIPDEDGIIALPVFTAEARAAAMDRAEEYEVRLQTLASAWRVGRRTDVDPETGETTSRTKAQFDDLLEDLDRRILEAQINVGKWINFDLLSGPATGCDPATAVDGACPATSAPSRPSYSATLLLLGSQQHRYSTCLEASSTSNACIVLQLGQTDSTRHGNEFRPAPPPGLAEFERQINDNPAPVPYLVLPDASDMTDEAERIRDIYFQILANSGSRVPVTDPNYNPDFRPSDPNQDPKEALIEPRRVEIILRQIAGWQETVDLLVNERALLLALYNEIVRQIQLDTRRATAELRDRQAVANVAAGARAPATLQDGQRFARVHATPRRTGAALEFDTSGNDIDSVAGDAVFFDPHGTSDEQLQYRVQTSGTVNGDQDIVARDGLLYEDAAVVLPAAVPPSSDVSVISHASGDAGRFPARGTVFRGGLRGAAARGRAGRRQLGGRHRRGDSAPAADPGRRQRPRDRRRRGRRLPRGKTGMRLRSPRSGTTARTAGAWASAAAASCSPT